MPLSRSQRLSVHVVFAALAFELWSRMGSDGCQTQRRGVRGSWERSVRRKCWQVPSRLMEGRYGSVNSVPNLRRCNNNIPAGLRRKYRQAVAARTGEGLQALLRRVERRTRGSRVRRLRLKSFGRRLSGFEDKEERQDKMYQVTRKESVVEEDWGMEMEDEVEGRTKWDEQRKRLQRQLREVERFTDVPQEAHSSLKENLQLLVDQRRNDLLLEHQRVQKRSHKKQSNPGQEEEHKMQRETAAAREEMRKIREDIILKEERILLLSDKVAKHEVAEAEMEAELQGLQRGEERRGSNASQAVDCRMETMLEQILALGADQARSEVEVFSPKVL